MTSITAYMKIHEPQIECFTKSIREALRILYTYDIFNTKDISTLPSQLGIPVIYDPYFFKHYDKGGISKYIDGKPTIMIDSSQHPLYQLYTLGKEIGHCQLHLRKNPFIEKEQAHLEAQLFNFMLLLPLMNGLDFEEFSKHNPEYKETAYLFRDTLSDIYGIPYYGKFLQFFAMRISRRGYTQVSNLLFPIVLRTIAKRTH